MSGIRVDVSRKFATSTRTSYLAPVAPSYFCLCFFLVVVDSTGTHLENHGHLRGIHIEHVLLNRKCSTKKIGMTSPNSRTYEVPEFAGTEFNRRSGNLKGLTGYLHKHFTKKVAGIAGRQQHHMNKISANIRAPRRRKQPTCKCCSYITSIHQYPPSRSRSVAET